MADTPAELDAAKRPGKMVLARTLQDASHGAFLSVDNRGRVRSPARFHLLQSASYGFIVAAIGASTYLWIGAIGLMPGVGIGVALTTWTAWMLRSNGLVKRGVLALEQERYDQAIAAFETVMRMRFVPRSVRALGRTNLASAHRRQGNLEIAAEHYQAAQALWRRSGRSLRIHGQLCDYALIGCLAQLGRIEPARAQLRDKRVPDDDADYLQVVHWGAELELAMAEGRHDLDPDELHRRAVVALGITTAAPLLGLLAWAHHHTGDIDQAWHLLREAYERKWRAMTPKAMPVLFAWMEAHAAEAGVGAEER